MKQIEIELKFKVKDVVKFFASLKGLKPKVMHVKDEVFGKKNEPAKIRKRTIYSDCCFDYVFEKTTPINDRSIKKVLEEKNINQIPRGWKCENSYDKIRYEYQRDDMIITVDFYSIGVFVEFEGPENKIKKMAKMAGFDLKDNITKNIDCVFCDWWKNVYKTEPPFHWGFDK